MNSTWGRCAGWRPGLLSSQYTGPIHSYLIRSALSALFGPMQVRIPTSKSDLLPSVELAVQAPQMQPLCAHYASRSRTSVRRRKTQPLCFCSAFRVALRKGRTDPKMTMWLFLFFLSQCGSRTRHTGWTGRARPEQHPL